MLPSGTITQVGKQKPNSSWLRHLLLFSLNFLFSPFPSSKLIASSGNGWGTRWEGLGQINLPSVIVCFCARPFHPYLLPSLIASSELTAISMIFCWVTQVGQDDKDTDESVISFMSATVHSVHLHPPALPFSLSQPPPPFTYSKLNDIFVISIKLIPG